MEQRQNPGTHIKNVWVYNMDCELEKISKLIEKYPYVAVVSALITSMWVGH